MSTQDVLDTVIGAGNATLDPKAAKAHAEAATEAFENGERVRAIEEMRKAAQLDSEPDYQFRLAWMLDLCGEEDQALDIYEHLAQLDPPHVNTLINLSIIYEDAGDIALAEKCLRQVLETSPNHERARLYMKDVQGSRDMYYDEEHARDLAKQNALLETPVTDFELTVRARNCLKKMQIRTLGDLLKVSEAELLSYKNFGETSLVEIKYMLKSKGLRLGQGLEGQYSRVRKDYLEKLRDKAPEAVLNEPISVLER